MTRRMGFILFTIEREAGQLIVRGRCSEGPIKVGDRFLNVHKPVIAKSSDCYKTVGRSNERSINLSVAAIETYGRSLDELDQGLSGTLTLAGKCEEVFSEGEILASHNEELNHPRSPALGQ